MVSCFHAAPQLHQAWPHVEKGFLTALRSTSRRCPPLPRSSPCRWALDSQPCVFVSDQILEKCQCGRRGLEAHDTQASAGINPTGVHFSTRPWKSYRSTIRDQAAACDKEGISETGSTQTGEGDDTSVSSGSVRTPTASGGLVPATTPRLSSTQPLVLLLQLLPALLYPALYTYVAVLVILGVYSGTAKLHSFGARWLLAIGALGIVRAVLLPCIPVLMKMALLGQVVPGRHPLWGDFYLRWFLVRQARLYFPQGIFNYSSGLRRAYLRALGARVAQGVEIGELGTTFIEGDLLTIAEGTWLDKNVDIQCSFLGFSLTQPCASSEKASGSTIRKTSVLETGNLIGNIAP